MRKIRIVSLLMAALCLLGTFVQAAGRIDLSKNPTLTLSYQSGKTPLSGASFEIFRVASVDETGELHALADFSSFDFGLRGENDAAWRKLSFTLEAFVQRRDITPDDAGKTGKDGKLTFPTGEKNLKPGLYLVTGARHEQGGYYYDAEPFFVMLPTQDTQKNEWVYDAAASVKYEKTPVPADDETITRKVLKIWEDDGHETKRPQSVTVELLKNGKLYDTVKLSAKNNWRYSWTDLDASARWTLTERTVDGYTSSVSREGITFVVTNTYKTDEKTPERPSTPSTPSNPSSPASSGRPTLPQTGAVWWPVGLLAALGLVFLIAGALDRKRNV